jgi:cephalosporin hydroxylase
LWACILEEVNPGGKVITVDIEDMSAEAREMPLAKRMVEFLIGSSTDPSIVKAIGEKTAGKKVVVILDSLHTKEHVYDELKLYAPMVSVGSYLIAQDTNINGHPVLEGFGPGPMEAVEQFLKENGNFEVDRSREKLLFTMHPGGYLKRIK